MNEILEKVVNEYNGPKLALIVTGGGIGMHQLAQTLGASKILHVVYTPYSFEESARFIREAWTKQETVIEAVERAVCRFTDKAVSPTGAKTLCQAGMLTWPTCRVIACSAATTTSRYRRGENQAYICSGYLYNDPLSIEPLEQVDEYHLPLSKLSMKEYEESGNGFIAWKRRQEDREITNYLLKIILNSNNSANNSLVTQPV